MNTKLDEFSPESTMFDFGDEVIINDTGYITTINYVYLDGYYSAWDVDGHLHIFKWSDLTKISPRKRFAGTRFESDEEEA